VPTKQGKSLKKPTPGPAHCMIKDIKMIDSTTGKNKDGDRPRFSFRVKHSEYELFIPDSVDGEFLF
jgi:hypothetical protein